MNNTLIIIGNGFDLAHTSTHKTVSSKNHELENYFDTSYKIISQNHEFTKLG